LVVGELNEKSRKTEEGATNKQSNRQGKEGPYEEVEEREARRDISGGQSADGRTEGRADRGVSVVWICWIGSD
jgi:hypothetical protein